MVARVYLIRNLIRIAFTTLFAMLILSPAGLAADASLKDDSFHYMRGGVNDHLYTEWWYFNGISNDTQFILTYILSDPDNISGQRKTMVRAVVMEDDSKPLVASRSSEGFGADRNNPSVDLAQSTAEALDGSTYKASGGAADEVTGAPLSWDLTYRATLSPWYPAPTQNPVGHLIGDWMKWLVYMPSARVSGIITLDNKTIDIDGTGYHDHIWGKWAFNDPTWTWAQVSVPEENFSLILRDTNGANRNIILGIQHEGQISKFTSRQVKVSYDDFTLDMETARTYPLSYSIDADNGDLKLSARVDVQKSVPITVDYPWPLPGYVIFEQVSRFNGTLRARGGEVYSFDRASFSEYTTHKIHTIYGKVNSTTPGAITVKATNQRTGQAKISQPSFSGYFSLDGNYTDYMENKTALWVENNDIVSLKAEGPLGEINGAEVVVNLTVHQQEAII
jgi:hypothetical protein